MRTCPVCGREVKGRANRVYDSERCRKLYWLHQAGLRFWAAFHGHRRPAWRRTG